MTAVPEGTTWLVFNEVTERLTSNGGMFYTLHHRPYIPVCRLDQRFATLIKDELERLREGEEVEMACIPDPTRSDDWRISLKYYEARYAESQTNDSNLYQLPTRKSPVISKPEPQQATKRVSVDLPIEYTDFLKKLYGHYKLSYTDCRTQNDFMCKWIIHQLEPYRWLEEIPF
jgi:hypothetical protein